MKTYIEIVSFHNDPKVAVLCKQFEKIGATPVVGMAVEGPLETAPQPCSDLTMGRNLTPGEVGCSLSHQSARQRFLKSEADIAIILEDDVSFDPSLMDDLSLLDCQSPRVMMLGWNQGAKGVLHKKEGVIKKCVVSPTGTFGYALNRAAATVLLQAPSRVEAQPADWPLEAESIEFWLAKDPTVFHPARDYDRMKRGKGKRLVALRAALTSTPEFTVAQGIRYFLNRWVVRNGVFMLEKML